LPIPEQKQRAPSSRQEAERAYRFCSDNASPWRRGIPDMAAGVKRESIRFFDRAWGQCAWPTGPVDEPGQMDMAICGAPTVKACYCLVHAKMSGDGVKRPKPLIPRDANVMRHA